MRRSRRSRTKRAQPHRNYWPRIHRISSVVFFGFVFLLLSNVPALLADSPIVSPASALALAACFALAVWATSDKRANLKDLVFLGALIAAWVALSALNGLFTMGDVGQTTRIVANNHILFFVVLGLFALAFASGSTHTTAAKIIVVAVIVHAGITIFESVGRVELSFSSGNELALAEAYGLRSNGFFDQPNVTAKFLVLGLACSLIYLPNRWALPLFLLVAIAVFFTGSRSNLLLMLLILTFQFRQVLGLKTIALTTAGAVVAVLALVAIQTNTMQNLEQAFGDNLTERVVHITDRIDSGLDVGDDSRDSREEAASLAWQTIADNPLGGSGVQTFDAYLNNIILTPHNTYAVQGLLFGIPGMLCVIALMALALIRSPKQNYVFVICFAASCWFSGENTQELFLAVMLAWVISAPRALQKRQVSRSTQRRNTARSAVQQPIQPNPAAVYGASSARPASSPLQRTRSPLRPPTRPPKQLQPASRIRRRKRIRRTLSPAS